MSYFTSAKLACANYTVRQLVRQDAKHLQKLFESCSDFFLLTDGVLPTSSSAIDEFSDVPTGKALDDLHIFGLIDGDTDALIGSIIAIRQYPNAETWWIGLMLLAPEYRGKGLGTAFYRAFERWVVGQGGACISLCAIAPNYTGIKFWQHMGFELVRTIPSRPYGLRSHEVHIFCRSLLQSRQESREGLL